jgi:hypothetical protein
MDAKTWNSSPPDAYPLALGKLFANIASLEFALRAVVYLCDTPADQRKRVARRLTALCAGDVLEKSALTSWDTLRELITKYNQYNPSAAISEDIWGLRDALAHGRILTDDPTSDLKLVRFSRPQGERVTVEKVETLSIDWLGRQIHRVHDAVVTVHGRMRDLAPD